MKKNPKSLKILQRKLPQTKINKKIKNKPFEIQTNEINTDLS